MADNKPNLAVILPVIGTVLVALLGGIFSILNFTTQKKAEYEQKKNEFRLHLLEKTLKGSSKDKAIENIRFYLDAGILEDKDGKLEDLLQREDKIPTMITVPNYFDSCLITSPKEGQEVGAGNVDVEGAFQGFLGTSEMELWIVAEQGDTVFVSEKSSLLATSHKWKGKINIAAKGKYTLMAFLTTERTGNHLKKQIKAGIIPHALDSLWLVDFVNIKVK
ncbi:hypothetical protein V6R21_18755 [Limibacter armeniacum]|uniref:hypothetical protein n=1 Tax=Limibacter armeniacum TaxID=466084 RepID=UPI002FE565F3